MSLALHTALSGVHASIPSPPVNHFDLPLFGWTLTIHYYALCIIAGIIVATLMTNHRLTKRGAERWVVVDICIIAVPLAIIAARIFHVVTHPGFYFGPDKNTWNPFEPGSVWAIWEGGIAIYGALIGGAIGAWLGCKWTGVRFSAFADALAPGLILAQAFGRFGNWFNHELFGQPTDLPWGLDVPLHYPWSPSTVNPAIPIGLPDGTLYQPTFLYEVIWNTLGAIFLLWIGNKLRLQWGKLFAVYLIWYGAGRMVWESIRIDPSEIYFGLRTNVWAALAGVVLGIVVLIVQTRRHPGAEPSPYQPGRQPNEADVDSQNDRSAYVDLSEPESDSADSKVATTSTAAAG